MILKSDIESLKTLSEAQADLISGGIVYGIIEGNTMTWVKASSNLKLDVFYVGKKLDSNSTTIRAIKENKVLAQSVERSVYGIRLTITSIPIIDENGDAAGAFSMAVPHVHPVAKAFRDFAPILVEMFSEGAFFFLSDLDAIIELQGSTKFNLTSFKIGDRCDDSEVTRKVLQTQKPQAAEFDSNKYGIPLFISSYPLFDEETGKIVGTIGIMVPKEVAANLRDMSNNLSEGLTGISSAIQELAASASQIHENQLKLNSEIKEVTLSSDKINNVSAFIKEIAEETKMLGLNAAIEAARAGQSGSGFGVVANEIRKLSDQAKSTVPQINELTKNIKTNVDTSSSMSQNSLSSSQEQAAATEEITANIEELNSLAENLNEIAQRL